MEPSLQAKMNQVKRIMRIIKSVSKDDDLTFDPKTGDAYGAEGHLVHPLIDKEEHWIEDFSNKKYDYHDYLRIHRESSRAINLQKFSSIFKEFENFQVIDTKYIKNILLDIIRVLHPTIVQDIKNKLDNFNVNTLCYNNINFEQYKHPLYSEFFILDEFEYVQPDGQDGFLTRSIRMKYNCYREIFESSNRLISVSFFVEKGQLKMRYFFNDLGNKKIMAVEDILTIDTTKPIRFYTFEILKHFFWRTLLLQGYTDLTYDILDDLFIVEDILSYN